MDEHLAGGVGRRLWVRRRYRQRRQRKPSQKAAGRHRRAFFWAGGGGGEVEWGAASLAAAAPKDGRRGDDRFFEIDYAWHAGPGMFFIVPHGAGAPDRVLPRRGRRGSAGYLFKPKGAPTRFLDHR
jgi:hypothetical protein